MTCRSSDRWLVTGWGCGMGISRECSHSRNRERGIARSRRGSDCQCLESLAPSTMRRGLSGQPSDAELPPQYFIRRLGLPCDCESHSAWIQKRPGPVFLLRLLTGLRTDTGRRIAATACSPDAPSSSCAVQSGIADTLYVPDACPKSRWH